MVRYDDMIYASYVLSIYVDEKNKTCKTFFVFFKSCVTIICLSSFLSSYVCMCFSWIFARKWPNILQGPQLNILCGFLSLSAWTVVISPVVVLIIWGSWLIVILGRDIIGLVVIMAGTALLLAFYSIMLWWRTQWQSSSTYFIEIYLYFSM